MGSEMCIRDSCMREATRFVALHDLHKPEAASSARQCGRDAVARGPTQPPSFYSSQVNASRPSSTAQESPRACAPPLSRGDVRRAARVYVTPASRRSAMERVCVARSEVCRHRACIRYSREPKSSVQPVSSRHLRPVVRPWRECVKREAKCVANARVSVVQGGLLYSVSQGGRR